MSREVAYALVDWASGLLFDRLWLLCLDQTRRPVLLVILLGTILTIEFQLQLVDLLSHAFVILVDGKLELAHLFHFKLQFRFQIDIFIMQRAYLGAEAFVGKVDLLNTITDLVQAVRGFHLLLLDGDEVVLVRFLQLHVGLKIGQPLDFIVLFDGKGWKPRFLQSVDELRLEALQVDVFVELLLDLLVHFLNELQ